MPVLDAAWIREFYAAALQPRADDFAREAMRRLAEAVICDALAWHSAGSDRGPRGLRALSLVPALSEAALLDLGPDADGFSARLPPGWYAQGCPVEAVSRRVRHHVWFLRHARAFDDAERIKLAAAAEHLIGAEIIAREHARRLAAVAEVRAEPLVGEATVGRDGRLLAADARFRDLLQAAYPQWDGLALPIAVEGPATSGSFTAQGLVWRVARRDDALVVRVSHERRPSVLSPREQEIAERVAQGMTFKEIARELDLAQSTVSTHVYNIYAKLGIRRRYDLVQWLAGTAAPHS